MTDLQLAVLLRQYCFRLNAILQDLEHELSEHKQMVKGLMGPYETWPILDDLGEFRNELAAEAEKLEHGG